VKQTAAGMPRRTGRIIKAAENTKAPAIAYRKRLPGSTRAQFAGVGTRIRAPASRHIGLVCPDHFMDAPAPVRNPREERDHVGQ
jgi:hypothetical protein